jgi:surface antigen
MCLRLWRGNPHGPISGAGTPTRIYQAARGHSCRESQQTVPIGSETYQAYGTACRWPDGGWSIVR